MPMTSEEYVSRRGLVCPFCGENHIRAGESQYHVDGSTQSVTCDDCGKEWDDIYTLTGYEEVSDGTQIP